MSQAGDDHIQCFGCTNGNLLVRIRNIVGKIDAVATGADVRIFAQVKPLLLKPETYQNLYFAASGNIASASPN